jgi:CRP-like cAMP-binding protein
VRVWRVLELTGTLSFANIEFIVRRIEAKAPPLVLVFDFSRVPMMTSGAAKVLAPNARGEFEQVGDIGAGKFFGEMALMTGEPRNATVIAESESELIAIGHEAFKATLDSHPSLAETMSRVLAERQARLQAHAAAGADDPREITERSHQLLSRIRSFFAL